MEGPKAPATVKESPTAEPITIEVVAKLRQPSSLRAAAPEFRPAKTPSEELDPLGRRVAYGGPSATNNLDGPEHLYGGYLVRMGETFAYGVGAGKEYDPITGKVLPGITLFSF